MTAASPSSSDKRTVPETETLGNVALVLEYEGTAYQGFQVQPGLPTVQGELEIALEKLFGMPVKTSGAGRTDAGVHALEQVVTFSATRPYAMDAIQSAMNFYLPDDIMVHAAYRVPADFDPRRDATSRVYEYTIWNAPTLSPMLRRVTHHLPHKLDVALMNKAAQALVGTHDFAAFTTAEEAREGSTVRTVISARVERKGSKVIATIESNAFLAHQVRLTIGALVDAGLGRLEVSDFARMVYRPEGKRVTVALPPTGLVLKKISYKNFPPARKNGAGAQEMVTTSTMANRR
ncbi:MAG: tRNA pseudouridine(38-40) synthase TruA [Dehalococcoidia bacterium]|nr:tRNA pseudouridine(38-40) synthase TruA [Dehalococcoidia bacterium]